MKHKGCGGSLYESVTKFYEYEGSKYPAVKCRKCGKEIIGDAEVEIPDWDN